jgi:hypothetical protein
MWGATQRLEMIRARRERIFTLAVQVKNTLIFGLIAWFTGYDRSPRASPAWLTPTKRRAIDSGWGCPVRRRLRNCAPSERRQPGSAAPWQSHLRRYGRPHISLAGSGLSVHKAGVRQLRSIQLERPGSHCE